ncbi:MAG: hypothetical protein GY810_03360 [Aureispira sp.]|nr:hypothetical protein [Aureispira sp.]
MLKFAQSPYHQSRQDVYKLFSYLNKFTQKSVKHLEKETILNYVYPNQSLENRKAYDLATLALKTLEDFLAIEHFQKQRTRKLFTLLETCQERKLHTKSNSILKKIDRQLQRQAIQNSDFLFTNYQFKHQQYQQHHLQQQQRNAPVFLQEVTDSLDVVYIAEKLKQACTILAHQAVYKTDYQTGLLPSIIDFIQKNEAYLEYPAIGIYYYCYQSLSQPHEDRFFDQFKSLILKHTQTFPKQELRDLYLLAINYGIKAYNNRKKSYLTEVFELYQQALKQDMLLQNNQLSAFSFKNIIGIALKLNQADWTKHFIQQYQQYLSSDIRETYVHYGTSKLFFSQKNYEKAMLLLQQVEYSDLFLNIDAKVMLLQMYYELGEYGTLESFLNSFKVFLMRKKLIGYHKDIYMNIIRLTQKLLHVNPFDKKEKQQLKITIEQTTPLTEKDWFLEQLQKL